MNDGYYRVQLRRSDKYKVKPSSEQVDGWEGYFMFGWDITDEESSIYGGECAMIAREASSLRPVVDIGWIASGDLVVIDVLEGKLGESYERI